MRPRAHLISLLGDELISDEPVAVVELVKNSYDADATEVVVSFEGDNPLDPDTLVVSDDGVGMTLEVVLGSWFEPGSVYKRREARSGKNRTYLGAKGIGRFASARLANALLMQTKPHNSRTGVTALLDWGKFDEKSYLDEITFDYEEGPIPGLKGGTTLTLHSLHTRKHWLEVDFAALHNRLARLISPFEAEGDLANFKIILKIPAYEQFNGQVKPHELTEHPKYKLSGTLTDAGAFDGEISIDGKIVRSFNGHPLADKDVMSGGFTVEIRAWDRDHSGLTPFADEYGLTVTNLRRILDDYCGVNIYRDGFRVYPYGEKGNDWLSLDTRSRQNPTLRLANNQIVAAIKISRESNPEIKDRSNREGLVHNLEYGDLILHFTEVISLLEEERYKHRPREENKPEAIQAIFEAFDLSDVASEAASKLGASNPISKMLSKKEADVRESIEKLQDHYSRVMLAAGFGQLVDLVVHEIGSPLGKLGREVNLIERTLRKARAMTDTLEEYFVNCHSWIEQISNLREKLLPRAAGYRGKTQKFNIREEICSTFDLFNAIISRQKIRWVLHPEEEEAFFVKTSRSSFGQVVANLIDNAIYWISTRNKDNGGRIQVDFGRDSTSFWVQVSDNGPGVAVENRARIFDLHFTTKPHGMGMGLYVARQVIEPYGRLLLEPEGPLPGATFKAIFEKKFSFE